MTAPGLAESGRLPGIGWAPIVGTNYSDEWYTPRAIVEPLGLFDFDPAGILERPLATRTLTVADDGLSIPWEGRVWLNPPYSEVGKWMARLATHGHGTALVFARTETEWFHSSVWNRATAALFLKGRVSFERPDGSVGDASPSPSVLVAYGWPDAWALENSGHDGGFVIMREYFTSSKRPCQ